MAKKEPIRYYLCNGESGKANGINLKVDGELQRDFIDISALDLQTFEIKSGEAKSILAEYNEGIYLDGRFFDTQYPYKDTEKKTMPVLFKNESDELNKHFNTLVHLAELRKYQKDHKYTVKLEDTTELKDFYWAILYRIIKTKDKYFYDYTRSYSTDLKKAIEECMNDNCKYWNINDYIAHILYSHKINGTLHNYTQLRLLFLEYSNYLNKLNYYINRNHITTFDSYSIDRLSQIDNQISLFDIIDEDTKKLERK